LAEVKEVYVKQFLGEQDADYYTKVTCLGDRFFLDYYNAPFGEVKEQSYSIMLTKQQAAQLVGFISKLL
jgi:hypothetical protein